jgi:hypothetical protein
MNNGHSPFTFSQRSASNFFWMAEHLLKSSRFDPILGKAKERHRARLLAHLEKRADAGRIVDVQRIPGLTIPRFRKEFHHPGVPVIFAGAAKSWRCQRWTPEFFAENYGDEMCSITDYGDDQPMRLADVVALNKQRRLRASHFSRVVHNHQELMDELDTTYLRDLCGPLSHKTSYQFFIGPPDVETHLHAGGTNNFHVQVYGEKTWWIVDIRFNPVIRPKITGAPLLASSFDPRQADDRFPTDRYVDVYRAKLLPGDMLFIPSFYWHHVSYDTESVATGFRWVTARDIARAFMMYAIMATATNPPFFEYYLDIVRGKLKPFYGSRRSDQLVR